MVWFWARPHATSSVGIEANQDRVHMVLAANRERHEEVVDAHWAENDEQKEEKYGTPRARDNGACMQAGDNY